MADIPEQPAAWPEIPLIATTDPVLGGINGAANRQAVKIMQRMQMAKDIADAATSSLAALSPLVTAARTRADDATTAAQAAWDLGDSAYDLASAAQGTAVAAQSAASTAQGTAAAASTAAATADGKAVAAQSAASTADGKAIAAQTKADQADTKATAAQTAAGTAETNASNASTTATNAMTLANTKATRIDLGTVSLTYSAALAIGAGARSVAVNCTGARVGDATFVAATGAIPDGYAVGAAQCLVADVIRVSVVHPALVLGASFTIPLRVFALR